MKETSSWELFFTPKMLCKPFDKFSIKEELTSQEMIAGDNSEATEESVAEFRVLNFMSKVPECRQRGQLCTLDVTKMYCHQPPRGNFTRRPWEGVWERETEKLAYVTLD